MVIGFSIDLGTLRAQETAAILDKMLAAGCQAVQVHLHMGDRPEEVQALSRLKDFSHRTIHIPKFMDEKSARAAVGMSKKAAELMQAHDFTLHPTGLKSFGWLGDEFGSRLNIENVDWRPDFGKTPRDLEKVFEQLPEAGWTFDVNHIFTNDSTMRLAGDFYEKLAPRLKQYHLSGFGGDNLRHTLLANTKQDQIISWITDKTKPIIIESLGPADLERFQEELDYLANFFEL